MKCVTVNIICKILRSRWTLILHLEYSVLQSTLREKLGHEDWTNVTKSILVLKFLDDGVWTKLQNAYFRLHHKACSETTQYTYHPSFKKIYIRSVSPRNRPGSNFYFLSQEKHVQSLYSQESGRSMHGEIIHMHSFILSARSKLYMGSVLGLNCYF